MYNHWEIESKWQKYWSEHDTFTCVNPELENSHKPKFYALDMFPYPSGAGLHVGHPKGYTATDIIARYKHAKWYHVLHPMGWDAFGLPAENYAIKTGTHPAITTAANIDRFREQLKKFGFSFDWNREVDTTNPEYYKWSQWIFLKLFEAGLAYESDKPINFCPSCKTGLANEEVVDGKCERCGTPVEKKAIRQWILAITKYADRLLSDIDRLDWPEGIKEMQRNWIWKSEGCQFFFKGIDCPDVEVFTTRIDTVFGVTYVVVAPDHPHVNKYIISENKKECEKYIKKIQKESELERTKPDKEKTGVFTGSYVSNPFSGEKVPVWIADYVLGHYGTGAVMAVPGHDERDFEFAKKYNLSIKEVNNGLAFLIDKNENNFSELAPKILKNFIGPNLDSNDFNPNIHNRVISLHRTNFWENYLIFSLGFNKNYSDKYKQQFFEWLAYENINYSLYSYVYEDAETLVTNSWEFDWLTSAEARKVLTEKAEKEWFGKKVVNYKLRDWIFSRQRYWGEPIPLIHIKDEDKESLPTTENDDCWIDGDMLKKWDKTFGKITRGISDWLLPDWDLPLRLPEVEKYEPSGDGQSPLATIPAWVHVQLGKNLSGYRETNTMPQWAGSCWYYLRFMDPTNSDAIVDPAVVKYWGEVDSYIGGAEHAVLHLLYARFWHKFLFDIGVVPTDEPFFRLRNVGLILWPDGNKMSKSKGNVINPDDVIAEYGADTLRLYEMSMADFSDVAPWNTKAIVGSYRLLEKIYRLFITDTETTEYKSWTAKDNLTAMKMMHKTIKKVGEDIENMKFNTGIAAINIMVNEGIPTDPEHAHDWKSALIRLLQPFAPHMAEECWSLLWNEESIYMAEWPEFISAMTIDDEVQIAIQIGGKLRGTYPFLRGVTAEEVRMTVENKPEIAKWLEGVTVVKEVFIPNKILNIVVK